MDKNYTSETQKRFKKFAPFYDLMTETLILGLRKKVVKLFTLAPNSKILDVPCGTGEFAIRLAKKGYKVYGADISPDMLKIARKKDKEKKIQFFQSDSAHLNFPDNYFDGAIISFDIHEMPYDIGLKTLLETKRTVRNGGQIIILDFTRPKNKIIDFLSYHFSKIWEEKEFDDFMKVLIEPYLQKTGLKNIKKVIKFQLNTLQATVIINTKI